MDKKTIEHIIRQLRAASLIWHVRNEAINRYREHRLVGQYKNGTPKYKYYYPCQGCGEFFDSSDVLEIDHIDEIGSFYEHENWDIYVRKMFCDLDNLQALCIICHDKKTALANSSIRFKRKEKKLLFTEDDSDVPEETPYIVEEDLM